MKRALNVSLEGRYERLYEEVVEEKQGVEPAWLLEQRQEAFDRVVQLGFPTRRTEAWKYTDVSALAAQVFTHGRRDAAVSPGLLDLPIFCAEDITLVFVDGLFRPELSSDSGGDLIRVTTLDGAAAVPSLRGALSRTNAAVESPFVCLNRALWRDGLLLRVPGKRRVERRVHVSFVRSEKGGETIACPRVVMALGDLSETRLLVSHLGGGAQRSFSNAVIDIDVGDGARLEAVTLQSVGRRCDQLSTTRICQGRDSDVSCLDMALGARLYRHDLAVSLRGEGSHLRMDGLYAGTARQVFDFHTVIEHCRPHCTSRQLYKGLLDERASATFNGLVRVHPGAEGTDGEQMNRNLLLSSEAKVNSKPELEILNDDVRCTHGATVGQLDQQELFYLQSRGLDPVEARAMLSRGFIEEVLYRLSDTRRRDELRRLLDWTLNGDVIPGN